MQRPSVEDSPAAIDDLHRELPLLRIVLGGRLTF